MLFLTHINKLHTATKNKTSKIANREGELRYPTEESNRSVCQNKAYRSLRVPDYHRLRRLCTQANDSGGDDGSRGCLVIGIQKQLINTLYGFVCGSNKSINNRNNMERSLFILFYVKEFFFPNFGFIFLFIFIVNL